MIVNPQYGDLSPFIGSLPVAFEQTGRLLFEGRNKIKSFVVERPDGNRLVLVVKRYKRPNFFQKIAYTFFCPSKARRAYENALVLKERGFATPEGYAYLETYRRGLIDYCYFISAEDTARPICERLNEPVCFDTVMAADFARFAARLHERGIIDVDLNSTNVLFTAREGGGYDFSLIDINRMHIYAVGTLPPQDVCMENLTRFTGRMDLFEYVARVYVESRGWPAAALERLIRTKREHDRRWRRRKAFLHGLKAVISK